MFYGMGNSSSNICTPGGFKAIAQPTYTQPLNRGSIVVTQLLSPLFFFGGMTGINSAHTRRLESLFRPALAMKVNLVVSFLGSLIDLLNLASSKYTILPTEPLKEDGKSLQHKSRRTREVKAIHLMCSGSIK